MIIVPISTYNVVYGTGMQATTTLSALVALLSFAFLAAIIVGAI